MKKSISTTILSLLIASAYAQNQTQTEGQVPMFAVIYQTYLKPGKEAEYQQHWRKIATYFVEQRGAIGSCLHRTPEGIWVAYSRWPSKALRDASWPGDNAASEELSEDIRATIAAIKECGDSDRRIPEICLEVIDDLLLQ